MKKVVVSRDTCGQLMSASITVKNGIELSVAVRVEDCSYDICIGCFGKVPNYGAV